MNETIRHYHLVGIGGAGLSGLARILLAQGHRVSGTDAMESATLDGLRGAGAAVSTAQDGSAIPADTHLVVASLAIADDNPELIAARSRGIEVVAYPEALGRLMAEHRGLCVAGTHGKTTVTAALAYGMSEAGLDPSFLIGGDVPQLAASAHAGSGEWFVAEACEYRRAFLAYRPEVAIITNVEADHLDCYRDEAEVVEAFQSFAARVSDRLFVCAESPGAQTAARAAACSVETYGLEVDADWAATRVEGPVGQAFCLRHGGDDLGRFDLLLPGRHNLTNAAGVVAAAHAAGAELDAIRSALASFRGAARRFERYGEHAGVQVVDDFAHHPTEIRSLLAAARETFPGRRIVCVFQPHQYSRTCTFLREFGAALAGADDVLVAPIYAARDSEADRMAVSSADVADQVRLRGGDAAACRSLESIAERLVARLRPGDVLLTIGAGDVWKVAKAMVRRLGGVCQV